VVGGGAQQTFAVTMVIRSDMTDLVNIFSPAGGRGVNLVNQLEQSLVLHVLIYFVGDKTHKTGSRLAVSSACAKHKLHIMTKGLRQ
jgi:hypothetical protein